MVCARGMLATGRAAYRRRGSSNARNLCGPAVWFRGLSCHQRRTRPPAFGYPAKDQAKAGGRVRRVMSMLVLDKLHHREISSCQEISSCGQVALLRARPVVWWKGFGFDWSTPAVVRGAGSLNIQKVPES
jgi:hypothetical protein